MVEQDTSISSHLRLREEGMKRKRKEGSKQAKRKKRKERKKERGGGRDRQDRREGGVVKSCLCGISAISIMIPQQVSDFP